MSLVEMALKKMRDAARGAGDPLTAREAAPRAARSPIVVGEVRERTGSHRVLPPPDPTRRYNPDKVVHIDQNALCAAGLLAPEHQQRELTDQYRQVKRPLIAAAIGRGVPRIERGQAIMMASAMAGEGKTFTAINLAMSISMERDVSVLLVDADVPKPHISRTFGVEKEIGLLDVLRDESMDAESAILPTDRSNLSLLPAGQRSETATELLASHRMEETIRRLAEADPNRIVIIDSPPLLLTSESRALAHSVGQVVIVVRADVTPQQAVLDAISYIGEGKSISLVLNQCTQTSHAYYYGYGEATSA
jgi:protein-tyrosine kinase